MSVVFRLCYQCDFFCRMADPESVQFFQFDSEGNMYMFEPGAGCTGASRCVEPGDEMIFGRQSEFSQEVQIG